jgi:PleD family two-component response regulator
VEEFAEAVEQIFGSGAQLLLKAIAKELYLNLGLEFDESKKFNFAKLVREAERYFLTAGGGNLLKKKGKVLESVGNESEKTRMLVVDEDIRRVLTEILEGEGYVVDSVGTSTTSILKSNERAFP